MPGAQLHESVMTGPILKANELSPHSLKVNFSEGVRNAFRDLAVALHHSESVSPEMLATAHDIAEGKPLTVDGVIGSLPLLAEAVFTHVHATGDRSAAKAWREIGSELLESGFTLVKNQVKTR
jgi:hypothetical protein